MATEEVIYEDKYIKLTKVDVIIKCYYFPFGCSRQVNISSIKALYIEDPSFSFKLKSWGMAWSPIWWALACCRECRNKTNVALDIGDGIMKGFSVERKENFLGAIRALLPPDTPISDKLPGCC